MERETIIERQEKTRKELEKQVRKKEKQKE